ncbi:hypothetical protein CkaCkLH20_02207 [Colletotrichum karsti]|uniref:Ipa protein n=1 Tax=Colletotrichum karsti TaxID=1095194 RepID=A0A9P6IAR3_9PEZI|nr:uncharacterized protein CkaCkLH20_02207 [Colletotrichum karsti]KAF9880253.1 hypothetical protein CkaCkLH20_02207 [Colletotrichum karsti]
MAKKLSDRKNRHDDDPRPYQPAQNIEVLREIHGDLAHRWRRHATTIEAIWSALTKNQRARCLLAAWTDLPLMSNHQDPTVRKKTQLWMPERDLQSLAANPACLLDQLNHRATTSLQHQLFYGCREIHGDRKVVQIMTESNPNFVEGFTKLYRTAPNRFTFFPDNKTYGDTTEVIGCETVLASWASEDPSSICTSEPFGWLLTTRQMQLYMALNSMVREILDQKPDAEHTELRAPPSADVQRAIKVLTGRHGDVITNLIDLSKFYDDAIEVARIQEAAMDAFLKLYWTRPGTLKHDVERWFCSQPGMIKDEKDDLAPVHTDRYSSASVFNVVQNHVKGSTTWKYVAHLLRLLQGMESNNVCRPIILQELVNCLKLEWERTRGVFRRYIRLGRGKDFVTRLSDVFDDVGNPQVVMKPTIKDIVDTESERYFLVHLAETSQVPEDITFFYGCLIRLWEGHPETNTFLCDARDHENRAFWELVMTSNFCCKLSQVLDSPPTSTTEGTKFVSKCHTLEVDFLNSLKKDKHIDLRDFCGPISVLLRSGMAEGCLKRLDTLVTERMGTTIRGLYDDVLKDAIADLSKYCQEFEAAEATSRQDKSPASAPALVTGPKEKASNISNTTKASMPREKNSKQDLSETPMRYPSPPSPARAFPRKQIQENEKTKKKKTRPISLTTSHSAEKSQVDETSPTSPSTASPMDCPMFRVKPCTAEFFWSLFGKARARSTMSWKSFEAAMADLGFSVMRNKGGSSVAFVPPDTMPELRPISIHAPHHFQIEGYRSLILSRRLTRAYGWDENTFQIA